MKPKPTQEEFDRAMAKAAEEVTSKESPTFADLHKALTEAARVLGMPAEIVDRSAKEAVKRAIQQGASHLMEGATTLLGAFEAGVDVPEEIARLEKPCREIMNIWSEIDAKAEEIQRKKAKQKAKNLRMADGGPISEAPPELLPQKGWHEAIGRWKERTNGKAH